MDKVTVYVTQDATADGAVTVEDLVRLKRFQSGANTEITSAGKKALSVVEGVLPATALIDMQTRLLESNTIGAKEISEDIVGEMGPTTAPTGSYITAVSATEEGTSALR